MSSGLSALGYRYVNVDDCWQGKQRDPLTGSIEADKTRFPSGIAALGEYIHSKGLQLGIYSSAGFRTCEGYPASLGIELLDATTYAAWGVDYLKYDNCYNDHGSPQSRYSAMESALLSTGRGFFYSLCEWGRGNPAVWAPTVGGNSWRISDDIKDNWQSIATIIDIDAPLWRYAGVNTGWNDPDMLEVGNGGCSIIEYETHYSMWAMLNAPLIIGNDIRELELPSKVDIKRILSNAEVIAVNQDPLGYQARRVWSDYASSIRGRGGGGGGGGRVIAVKCSSGNASSSYEDSVLDQTWLYQGGRIRSASTGLCLHEQLPPNTTINTTIAYMARTRSVTTVDCREASYWDAVQYRGGPIVSRSSRLCLEVDTSNNTASHGKLIQTAPCKPTGNRVDNDDERCVDHSQHQSWTNPPPPPPSTSPGPTLLLNLYQRQCLTIDRDAPSGGLHEVWSVPLQAGAYAVTLLNKGPIDGSITIDTTMLGLSSSPSPSSSSSLSRHTAQDNSNNNNNNNNTTSYSMRDLWLHREVGQVLRVGGNATFPVRSHGVVLLKLVPI